MAIGNMLAGIAGAAYNAYKTAEDKKKTTTQKATPAVQNTVKNQTTPTTADHQSYISNNYAGGIDAYTKLQQQRYNGAYATGDQDLINRLNSDSATRGYSLSQPQQTVQSVVANPYEEYMKQYESKVANLENQILDKNNAAVAQGVDRLNSQKATINQGFDNSARQAYITSMQSKNALPQQLAVQGINGGATESAMLGLSTNYQNNLSNINTNRQNSLLDIDNAVIDLKNSGDLSTSEQILQNNQAALTAYQNMLNNSASYNQWLANYKADRSDTEYNQDYQKDRDTINDTKYDNETATSAKQTEYNNILNRLGMGLISANDAVALGVPAADVQAYVNRIKAAQSAELANTVASTNKINSSGSKSSEIQTSPVTTADKYLAQGNRTKAIDALASIYTNAEIKQYLESKNYRTDDIEWETATSTRYQNPVTSIGNIVAFYKNKGYTNEQIASILNK